MKENAFGGEKFDLVYSPFGLGSLFNQENNGHTVCSMLNDVVADDGTAILVFWNFGNISYCCSPAKRASMVGYTPDGGVAVVPYREENNVERCPSDSVLKVGLLAFGFDIVYDGSLLDYVIERKIVPLLVARCELKNACDFAGFLSLARYRCVVLNRTGVVSSRFTRLDFSSFRPPFGLYPILNWDLDRSVSLVDYQDALERSEVVIPAHDSLGRCANNGVVVSSLSERCSVLAFPMQGVYLLKGFVPVGGVTNGLPEDVVSDNARLSMVREVVRRNFEALDPLDQWYSSEIEFEKTCNSLNFLKPVTVKI